MSKVEKFLILFSLVICVACGLQVDESPKSINNDYPVYYDDYNGTQSFTEPQNQSNCVHGDHSYQENEEFKAGPDDCWHCVCKNNKISCKDVNCPIHEPEPVEEDEVVTKNYYTVGQTATQPTSNEMSLPCMYQDQFYRHGEHFRLGVNNCSICTCFDTEIRCDDDKCLAQVIPKIEVKSEKNFTALIPKEKLKVPEINTTTASLIPENHPENLVPEDTNINYEYSFYFDYDDNGALILVEDQKQRTCVYDGRSFREDEEFKSGPDDCLHCVCKNNEVNCKNVNCPYPVAAVALESRISEQKVFINATALNDLIEEAEKEIKKFDGVEKIGELLDVVDGSHNKYDTTDLLINCCNIGTYMPNCSDTGIDSVMINPPAGLCRSTIKHCCMLNNKDFFDPTQFKCDPQQEEHLTCCAVCKIGNKISDVPANFKSLMTHCCDAPQPLIQHKREKNSCRLGYRWNDATSKCVDIDECQVRNNGCCESQDCENFDGGYRCIPRQICKIGYEFDEDYMECRDYRYTVVNDTEEVEPAPIVSVTESEPEDSTYDAPIKVNLPIECILGYQYDPETESCVDIDECLDSPCEHTCKNLEGNFQCFCRRGYKAEGNRCIDIDECQKNPCSHTCVNVKGSFRCHCPAGMVLGFDRKNCIVRVMNTTCPDQYKIHKTVDDKAFLKCVRTPCESDVVKCKALPKYLTYKSLTLPRNFKVTPQGYQIFNIKTKSIKVKVEHKTKVSVESKGTRVRPASVKDFSIKQEPNRILVSLMRPLSGPQIFTLNINLIKDETKIMESIEIKITVE